MKNLILNTDSYKMSHFNLYPEGLTEMYSYMESRGGVYNSTVFFGLQPILKELEYGVSMKDVYYAKSFAEKHGVPFNFEGWKDICLNLGYLPIEIKAVKEGTIVPTGNVLLTIRNTHPNHAWLTSYLETLILRTWYPITVATRIYSMKQNIKPFFEETCDNMNNFPFAILDFSSRGCSSYESSQIGGSAYLANFIGSDNVPAVEYVNKYYESDMSGFSIPATEHSIMCSFGEDDEKESLKYLIDQTEAGGVISIVSDTWDIYRACGYLAELADYIKSKNITVVVRPDSGDIEDVLPKVVGIICKGFGSVENSKGYEVINNAKILWGDGIDERSCTKAFDIAKKLGLSADSILTGSGGGLMQKNIDRDTCRFAVKGSNVIVNGKSRPIAKDPVTDRGKKSKKGKFVLLENRTYSEEEAFAMDDVESRNMLETVFLDGKILRHQSIDEIREILESNDDS